MYRSWFSMQIAMWSPGWSPAARSRRLSRLAAASSSANVWLKPEPPMVIAGLSPMVSRCAPGNMSPQRSRARRPRSHAAVAFGCDESGPVRSGDERLRHPSRRGLPGDVEHDATTTRRDRVARRARPPCCRVSDTDRRGRCGLSVRRARLPREHRRLLRLAEFVPRSGDRNPCRHPDQPVGADDRSRQAGRRPARRRRNAGPLPGQNRR